MEDPGLSEQQRRLLAAALRGNAAPMIRPDDGIRPGLPAGMAPLSLEQEQLWMYSRQAPGAVPYNEVAALVKDGALDVDALREAFNQLVARHDIWHTVFRVNDAVPSQLVVPPVEHELPVLDLSGFAPDERRAALVAAIGEEAARPYDLENGPLLRPRLVRLAADSHRLYLCLHYLVFDGVSLYRIVLPELVRLYEAAVGGHVASLEPPRLQYADYARWQRSPDGADRIRERVAYWRTHLAGASPLRLPLTRPRPLTQRFRGSTTSVDVPAGTVEQLQSLARRSECTLFTVLISAFAALLHRYTGQDDLLLATLTDLRTRSGFEEMVGYCTTPVAVRAHIDPGTTMEMLVAAMRSELIDAGNCVVPFAALASELESPREAGAGPLFPALFVLEPPQLTPDASWSMQSVDALISDRVGKSNYDLYLEFEERAGGELAGRLTLNSDIFSRSFGGRAVGHWLELLARVAASPDRPVAELVSSISVQRGRSDPVTEQAGADDPSRGQPAVVTVRPMSALEGGLASLWSRLLGSDVSDLDASFFDLGGTSLLAVQLVKDIESQLEMPVPLTWLAEGGATVAGMARLITSREAAPGVAGSPALMLIWPNEPSMFAVRHLRAHLEPLMPVTSLVPDHGVGRVSTVGQLADEMVGEIRDRQPAGPYAVAGFSLGGVIAYHVAGRLAASGESIAWLGVLDEPTPSLTIRARRATARLARLLDGARAAKFHPAPGDTTSRASRWQPWRRIEPDGVKAILDLLDGYELRPHAIPTDVFVTDASVSYCRSLSLGWDREHQGPLRIHRAGTSHETMLAEPEVHELGRLLATRLTAARTGVSSGPAHPRR